MPSVDRPYAPRISLVTRYRSCPEFLTSASVPTSICAGFARAPDQEVLKAAAVAAAELRAKADGDALHAAGLIDLLWGDASGRSIDRSISYLEAATQTPVGTPDRYVDLSAALLRRGELRGDPKDVLHALERASEALVLDSTNSAAAFNRALALHRLDLVAQSASAFRVAASLAHGTPWGDEANEYARRDSSIAYPAPFPTSPQLADDSLLTRIALTNPQRLRYIGWDSSLMRWGECTLVRDSSCAARELNVAARIAESLHRVRGDSSLVVAIRAIQGADSATRSRLASGHARFGQGRDAYEKGNYATAIELMSASAGDAATSPALRQSALLWKGICEAQAGPPQSTARGLARIGVDAEALGLVGVSARAHASLASVHARNGEVEQSLLELEHSRYLHASIGEWEGVGLANSLEAVSYATIGDRKNAYRAALAATRTLRTDRTSIRLHNSLYLLAELALADSLKHAALALELEDVHVAINSGDRLNIAESRGALSIILRSLGNVKDASSELIAAISQADSSESSSGREWVRNDLAITEYESLGEEEAEPAVRERADAAINYFERMKVALQFLPGIQTRASRSRRAGDVDGARADLHTILSVVDRELGSTRDRRQQASLIESSRRASDELMQLELEQGRKREALLAVAWDGAGLLRSDVSLGALPRDEVVLDFLIVSDTLYAWVLSRDVVDLRRVPLAGTEWRRTLARTRSLLEIGVSRDAVVTELSALYETFFRPIEDLLPSDLRAVTVVCEGEITDVPFNALFDSVSSRYAIERFAIRHASTIAEALSGRRERALSSPRALVVADPAFELDPREPLDRLSGAVREGEGVAQLYARSSLLVDTAATRERVLHGMAAASVVHVAGHVVFDRDAPDEARIVLAGRDVLRAMDLEHLRLRSTQLVVLSACDAGRTGVGRGGGLLGLAAALRHAGVHSVVGGMWRVEDEQSRALMLAFHAQYQESGDAAVALRNAQVEMLSSGDEAMRSPSAWAGFRSVGR